MARKNTTPKADEQETETPAPKRVRTRPKAVAKVVDEAPERADAQARRPKRIRPARPAPEVVEDEDDSPIAGEIVPIDDEPAVEDGETVGVLEGAGRFVAKVVYSTCFSVAYGIVLPVAMIARIMPKDNALVHGLVDGASAATESVDHWKGAALAHESTFATA